MSFIMIDIVYKIRPTPWRYTIIVREASWTPSSRHFDVMKKQSTPVHKLVAMKLAKT